MLIEENVFTNFSNFEPTRKKYELDPENSSTKSKTNKNKERFSLNKKNPNYLLLICSDPTNRTNSEFENEFYLSEIISKQLINRFYEPDNHEFMSIRAALIKFAKMLVGKWEYSAETYYMSIAYMDAVFASCSIGQHESGIYVYSCVTLAAKLTQNEYKIPTWKDANKFLSENLSEESFRYYELLVFECLNFNLNLKTPYTFLAHFLTKGNITKEKSETPKSEEEELHEAITMNSYHFLEITATNYGFNKYTSHCVAVAVLICTRIFLGFKNTQLEIERRTACNRQDSLKCVLELLRIISNSNLEIYSQILGKVDFAIQEILEMQSEKTRESKNKMGILQNSLNEYLKENEMVSFLSVDSVEEKKESDEISFEMDCENMGVLVARHELSNSSQIDHSKFIDLNLTN